jgi:hypothetical protein
MIILRASKVALKLNKTYLLKLNPARITLFTALLAMPFISAAQYEHKLFSSNMMIETKFHYGFLYAHHLELERYNAHFPAFELSIQQLTYGKHRWERSFDYPIIGMTFFYSGLGYSPDLGQAYALMPFINFPLLKTKKFMLGFRFALGAGYLTERFDRLTNYKNLAIGSHLNAAVNLMFDARYRINYAFTVSGGICLQHFSNGSLKLPNYGINAPLINIGLAYRPVKENRSIGDRFYPPVEPFEAIIRRTMEFNFGMAVGWKNMQAVVGENYMVYHFSENTFIQVSRKSKFGLGFDVSYDPSQITILEKQGVTVDNKMKIIRPGVNAAYELIMSRLGFILNLGYYLGGMEKSNGPFYEKISVQYNFAKNFFASVMLKVHWGRADYIGWGLGYRFDVAYGKKTIK